MRIRRRPAPEAPSVLPSETSPVEDRQSLPPLEDYLSLLERGSRPHEVAAWTALRRLTQPDDLATLLSELQRWNQEDLSPEEQRRVSAAYRSAIEWVAEDQGRLQQTLLSVDELLTGDQGSPAWESERDELASIAADLVRESGPQVASEILRLSSQDDPSNSVFSTEVIETALQRADEQARRAILDDEARPLPQRVAAAKALTDPDALGPYLNAQSPAELVLAAFASPVAHDAARVVEVALTHPDSGARATAAGRVSDEAQALQLALSDDENEVVLAAIGALQEQSSLLEVVQQRSHTFAPQAIARLDSQQELTRLAVEAPTVASRRAALERGRDLYGPDWTPYRPQLSEVSSTSPLPDAQISVELDSPSH